MKVAICIPSKESCSIMFTKSLANMIKYSESKEIKTELFIEVGSILPDQRNRLVNIAKDSNADYILWLDTDMMFPSNILEILLSHKKKIIAANYSTKYAPRRSVAFLDENNLDARLNEKEGIFTVDAVGFGCILTHISVFDKILSPWFNFEYLPEKNGFLGEDFYFCKKARNADFNIFVDCAISQKIAHIGIKANMLENTR